MGDYSRKLDRYTNVSTSYTITASDDLSSTAKDVITALASYTIYVQRIVIAVTTDNAATQSFKDTAGTPVVVAGTKASPGIGPIVFDFGPEGFALTEGKGLQHANSAAGLAGSITVTAYRRLTGTSSA